jgi:hypothetical protein
MVHPDGREEPLSDSHREAVAKVNPIERLEVTDVEVDEEEPEPVEVAAKPARPALPSEEEAELLAARGAGVRRNLWGSQIDADGNVVRLAHPRPEKR